MDIDYNRIDDVVLALLWLNLETTGIAWKGFDWRAMERLHERGPVSDPVSKAKSVRLSEAGQNEGESLFRELVAHR